LLQRAKDLLQLQSALLKLDKYELLIVDDIICQKNRRGSKQPILGNKSSRNLAKG